MAHFAQLDENNIVTQVIVVSNEDIKDVSGNEVEEIGIAFCKKLLGSDTNWKQTSYNNNFRVRFAGIGFTYNQIIDAFVPPKPYESWILDETTADWQSPIGSPPELTQEQNDSFSYYTWDEENIQWILVTPSISQE